MPVIHVFLADNNRAMLADLRDELSKEFHIAGMAENGEDAIREVVRLDPDVLVLDINMHGLNGLQVASRLHKLHPSTKILFLTIHEQAEYIAAAFSAGTCGYVTKRRLGSDLSRAIYDVLNGRTFLSPSLHQ